MTESYETSGGIELTDEVVERLADEADAGYDIERLQSRSQWPQLGDEAP